MTANPWVRPYVLTGGRTRTRHHLYVHTLVAVKRYDPAAALRLSPEARRSILTPGKMMISPSEPCAGLAIRLAASSLRRNSRMTAIPNSPSSIVPCARPI